MPVMTLMEAVLVTIFFVNFFSDIVRPHHPHLPTNPVTTRDVVFFQGAQRLPHDLRDLHASVQGPHVACPGLHAEESHLLKENVQIQHESARHHHRNVLGLQKSVRSLHEGGRSLHEEAQSLL